MNGLQTNIDWLKKKPSHRLEVYDAVTEHPIDKSLSATEILSNFDNIEDYFSELEKNGHQKIAVQKARKHGNSQVRIGLMNKYMLGVESQSVAASGSHAQASPAVQQTNQAGLMGMSMPQIMTLNTKAEKYDEEKSRAERLQNKYDALEKENKDLERKNLRYELGVEAKPGALEKLLDTISENPELIQTAIQSLAAKKNQGLNAPTKDELSQLKTSLVQVISQKEVTDDIALAAYHLINQSISGNTEFIEAFKQILQNHKLIKAKK